MVIHVKNGITKLGKMLVFCIIIFVKLVIVLKELYDLLRR